MPVLVPHGKLAALLGEQTVQSSAPTVASLLEEVGRRLPRSQWDANRKVTILVNGRNIHYLQGESTPLESEDVVWMVVPSGGG